MIKSLKWYWKLLIILLIMFIIGTFFNKGFIINVQAKTDTNAIPGVVLIDMGTGLPIDEKLPCNSTNKLCTNLDIDFNATGIMNTQFKVNYFNSNNITQWPQKSQINIFTADRFITIDEPNTYYNRFEIGSFPYYRMEKNLHYSFMFTIESDNIIPFDNIIDIKNPNSNITFDIIARDSNYNDHSMLSYIENLEVYFYPGGTITNNTNYSFLKIDFDSLPTMREWLLWYLSISFNSNNINDYFFKNDNINGVMRLSQAVMVQDATLEVIPTTNYDEYFGLTSGSPLNDNSIYEDCSQYGITEIGENIACNTRNVVSGVKHFLDNLLFNITNLFEYVFIPNFNDIKDVISDGIEVVLQKLGFIAYPIELLGDLVNRFLDLHPLVGGIQTLTIDIPEVRDPFYNEVIIQPGTWALGQILTTGTIGQLYVIYKLFITAYLIFLFLCLCDDAFVSFINGDGGRVGTYTMSMMNSVDDIDKGEQARDTMYSYRRR